jgi:hypothetical protein
VAHDGARWGVAGYGFESGSGEGGGVSGVGGAGGFVCVEWVGFEGRGFGAFCGFDGCCDQRGGDALSSVADADVEAGERPDGQVVYALEPRGAVEPGQIGAGSELAPAYGSVAVEGDQARRWAGFYDLVEGGFVFSGGLFSVGCADAPVHAPAVVTCSFGTEEVFECGPEVGCEWADF